DIADMSNALKSGDLEKYMTTKQKRVVKSDELIKAELRKHQLKKEINAQIRLLQPKTTWDYIRSVYDIFRSAKLTADVGHIWRQGGFFMSNWKDMNALQFSKQSLDALFSEDKANALDLWVLDNEFYQAAKLAGLRLIEEGDQLDGREEILANSILDKAKGIGKVTKASGRAQLTGMNVLRMSVFESLMQQNPNATAADQADFAYAINILTGYGQGAILDKASVWADNFLISTRFAASRLQAPFILANPR
ncbi:unnamed protein product, partial [marine sediment metagenome]